MELVYVTLSTKFIDLLRLALVRHSLVVGMRTSTRVWTVSAITLFVLVIVLAVWHLLNDRMTTKLPVVQSLGQQVNLVVNHTDFSIAPVPVYKQISRSHTASVKSLVEPSPEPTAEPTAAVTQEPSISQVHGPSAEPSAEPSASPTISPTIFPSVIPSTAPTDAPTAPPTRHPTAPTVRPSRPPTVSPSKVPSAKPSLRPTPTPGSPTFRPTVSTHSPTMHPSVDPYPVETLLLFNSSVRCDNIDAFTFYDDPRIETAFISAFASTMPNITTQMVRVVSIIDVMGDNQGSTEIRRLAQQTNSPNILENSEYNNAQLAKEGVQLDKHHNNKQILSGSITITLQVVVVLETLGYTILQSNSLYTLLTGQAAMNVANNQFSTALARNLLTAGITQSITPDISSYRVSSYNTVVLQTAVPSITPTLSPTTVTITQSSNSNGGITMVDVIVIVTVIGSVVLLAGLLYGAHYEKQQHKLHKAKVAPMPGASVTAIVPSP